jgi:hypothetical protein
MIIRGPASDMDKVQLLKCNWAIMDTSNLFVSIEIKTYYPIEE